MIRYGVAALGLIGLILVGMKIAQWRYDAAAGVMLRTQVAEERAGKMKAQSDARILAEELRATEAAIHERIKDIKRKVVVNRSPDCAIPADTLRLLNDARGIDQLPHAAHPDDGPTVAPSAIASRGTDGAGRIRGTLP